MISVFLRELKEYTRDELRIKLECTEEQIVPVLRKLKECEILKAVKTSEGSRRDLSDLSDEDIAVAGVESGENEYLYVFNFVGVIAVAGWALKIYPKYLLHTDEPKKELRQVMQVLDKYNSREQIVRIFDGMSEDGSLNLLAVMLFLLDDFFENGLYGTAKEIIESNGAGEIHWDRTISETFALISGNRPYYTNLLTRKRVTDNFGWFRRLHECVLTKASGELASADLLELFGLTEVELSDETIDDFGEKDYILCRIEQELGTQFNSRKQLVLKTIYAYIEQSNSLFDSGCLSIYGTNSFNLVWETVCSEIMDNRLDVTLGRLQLPKPLDYLKYDAGAKLIDLIEKPLWTATGQTAETTLTPDLISVTKDSFIIFDAKYYNAFLESGKPPAGQPGIESVTKQYLYQLAYKQFISDHGFTNVKNCFLLPTEEDKVINKGNAEMKMLSALGLNSIQVRFIPAAEAYECYLSGRKMDIGRLELQ